MPRRQAFCQVTPERGLRIRQCTGGHGERLYRGASFPFVVFPSKFEVTALSPLGIPRTATCLQRSDNTSIETGDTLVFFFFYLSLDCPPPLSFRILSVLANYQCLRAFVCAAERRAAKVKPCVLRGPRLTVAAQPARD